MSTLLDSDPLELSAGDRLRGVIKLWRRSDLESWDTDSINWALRALSGLEYELHRARRGRLDPLGQFGYCAVCGEHFVWPDRGEDTCAECLKRL